MLWDHNILTPDIEITKPPMMHTSTLPAMHTAHTAFPSGDKPVDIVDTEMTLPSSPADNFSDVYKGQPPSFQLPLSPPLSPNTRPASQPFHHDQTPSFTFPTPPQTPPATTSPSRNWADAAAFQDHIDRYKLAQSQPSLSYREETAMDMTPMSQPKMAPRNLNQSSFINQATPSRAMGHQSQQRRKESQRNTRAFAQSSQSTFLPSKKKVASNHTTKKPVTRHATEQHAQPVAPSSRNHTPILDEDSMDNFLHVHTDPPTPAPRPQQNTQPPNTGVRNVLATGVGFSLSKKACQPKSKLTQPPAQTTQTSAQNTQLPGLFLANAQSRALPRQIYRQPTVETAKDEPELPY